MKKLILLLTALIIFAFPFSAINANDEIGFLEAFSNTHKLTSYKMLQGFYGDFKVDDYGDKADGYFRLSFSGNVNSDEPFENDQYSRVNGYLQINYTEGEYRPFDQFIVNLSGEVISIFGDGIYVRLNDLQMNGKGMTADDIRGMDEFIQEINQLKGVWYRIPMESFTDNAGEEMTYEFGDDFATELIDPETIVGYLQNDDIKTAIGEYFKAFLLELKKQGEMTDEEYGQALEAIDLIAATDFFNRRDIVSGRNIGFKFFNFNKGAVINLVQNIAEVFGETLTDYDLQDLRDALSRFNLAGIYRINTEHNIIDNFLVKLTLRNMESLEEMHVNYRYKISNFNDAPEVSAPADYVEIEESGTYIPYINDDYYYDELEYSDTELEDLECIECDF